ncbi:MAG: hypothetical protein ACOYBQ_10285 [Fluviibacter sp.]
MAEMLLINPRPRRKSRKAPSAAQRRARAAFAAAARARSRSPVGAKRRRRRNPVAAAVAAGPVRRAVRRTVRASNPVGRSRRRRRNPISLGSKSAYVNMIKDGLIGGAGALAVDVAMGYINPYLPATLQRTPGQVGVGDAVKALITIALGQLLAKPTKGMSMVAARGSLVVQSHAMLAQMLPSTVTLGYSVPSNVVPFSNRIGPNRRSLSQYTPAGQTPLLNRYTRAGQGSPLLSGRDSTMSREAVVR